MVIITDKDCSENTIKRFRISLTSKDLKLKNLRRDADMSAEVVTCLLQRYMQSRCRPNITPLAVPTFDQARRTATVSSTRSAQEKDTLIGNFCREAVAPNIAQIPQLTIKFLKPIYQRPRSSESWLQAFVIPLLDPCNGWLLTTVEADWYTSGFSYI